ncbi:hypothetical protein HanIR_Chr14g0718481 [Helianthus annuus]|nr:hypothetical protein HanIR_Chr14g0718481 [Helianthus annuus]
MMMRQKPRVSDPLMSGGNRELGSQEESNFDSFCFAEARKKKFLELYPKVATNYEPVQFRSSVILIISCNLYL